ncbi:MAG: zinc-dependent peptidase [Mariniblastus sp.]
MIEWVDSSLSQSRRYFFDACLGLGRGSNRIRTPTITTPYLKRERILELFSFFKNWRRNRILKQPFREQWLNTVSKNVWQYRSLNTKKQKRVRDCTQIMVAEKNWEGVDGFKITDEVKVTISATAGLLTLGLEKPFYFDRVESIIVYPGPIRNRQLQRGLVVHDEDAFYSGLAWQGGPLIFSWPSALRGSQRSGDGANVIIHEFVHHIDGLDGEMGGTPIIESADLRQRWEEVFQRRYAELVDDIESGRRPAIDEYGGTNLAEFFSVASESFFDSPTRLKHALPDVYDVLSDFFDIDPIEFD